MLYIKEEYVNRDTDCNFGSSGLYEPWTDNIGKLFVSLQLEYGRCIGHVYIGNAIPIGWVFEKRQEYQRSSDTYIQETWVSFAWKDDEDDDLYSRYDIKARKPVN